MPSTSPADLLTKAELAQRLDLSQRHIDNLAAEGMPRERRGRGPWRYRWTACLAFYVARKEQAAARRAEPASLEDARGRRETATARMAELDLAEREGQLVAVDAVERELAAVLQRLRARIVTMPSRYAHQLVGTTREEALKRLEEAATEMLTELQRDGEAEPDEEADELAA